MKVSKISLLIGVALTAGLIIQPSWAEGLSPNNDATRTQALLTPSGGQVGVVPKGTVNVPGNVPAGVTVPLTPGAVVTTPNVGTTVSPIGVTVPTTVTTPMGTTTRVTPTVPAVRIPSVPVVK